MKHKFIPIRINPRDGKKKPMVKWKTKWFTYPLASFNGQTNIGMINTEWICIDVDHPEMFKNMDEIVEKWKVIGPVIKTSRGYHFYCQSVEITEVFKSIQKTFIKNAWGEVRGPNSYQVLPNSIFGISLPNQKEYVPVNFSTFAEMEGMIQDIPKELIEELFHISIKGRVVQEQIHDISQTSKTPLLSNHERQVLQFRTVDEFVLGDYLPDSEGKNHDCIFRLARAIKKFGLQDSSQTIFDEWLNLNEFLRAGQDYQIEFDNSYSEVGDFTPFPKHEDLFIRSYNQAKQEIKFNYGRVITQKLVDRALELSFKEMGKHGQFHFSTKLMEPQINSKVLSRAILKLIKANRVKKVKDAYIWRPTSKKLMAAEYIWIG